MKKKRNAVTLDDKFEVNKGRVFISGTQAILRLLLIQKTLDTRAGLNTSGFVSGYRGSPMGMLDNALWREKERLDEAGIVFRPGVNEDLAATAVWGTQQLEHFPKPLVDGVYSIWYGKGPGVDRSGDALRHGNLAGTHRHGGVLVAYGDDQPGKSSTVACQSEPLLAATHVPSLYPANAQEIIDFGILGWALSRYSGLWVGLKCVNETIEQTRSVDIDLDTFVVNTPDRGERAALVNIQPGYIPALQQDITLKRHRLPLVHDFVRANNIDQVRMTGQGSLGIVTAGKTYEDVTQALARLGIDEDKAETLGLGLYKVGCIWPLEPEGLREFADNRPELLFIEEKDSFLEDQAARILVNDSPRPLITGKTDAQGELQFVSDGQLHPAAIAAVIGDRLRQLGVSGALACLRSETAEPETAGPKIPRTPYFCSGCPHNTSTKVPEGSLAMSGIGCHTMAIFKRGDTLPPTHMGGEGLNWVGAAPFSGTQHMFQNLGDGTYFHSGLLAIRAAVASSANITYKILYNDAVAMTGGQPVDGSISVPDMIRQVVAEGVSKCVLVSNGPEEYKHLRNMPADIEVYHRDDLEYVQTQMREIKGTSVIIYEQTCAAEKRRRRKRGLFPDPAKRLFINDAVCESCGDCSVQSRCVSILPVDTEFGIKRKIDQSGCNKDYSCVNGFCPSFVTVLDAEPRKPGGIDLDTSLIDSIPEPVAFPASGTPTSIMIAGIGGTGVITVGAVLGMAAHIEGRACSIFDMTGLSQKNGAVYSHLKIAEQTEDLGAQRIAAQGADLVLGFDLIAALGGDAGICFEHTKTRFVGNSDVTPTVQFQFDKDMSIDAGQYQAAIRDVSLADHAHFIDATRIAAVICGNTIASNMMIVGYALQKGLLPLSTASIERAIELNGVAVPFNLNAFGLGRLLAHKPDNVTDLLPSATSSKRKSTDELIVHRYAHLEDYQNKNYADSYSTAVSTVADAEAALNIDSDRLTRAIAINLARLMSYKDEYEVARLYAAPAFRKNMAQQFEPGYRLRFNLAPPFLSRKSKSTGLPMKREYGPWVFTVFKLLARLKFLRSGPFDIFGMSKERRLERQLVTDYLKFVRETAGSLSTSNLERAVTLAELPEDIRGFGHVKIAAMERVAIKRDEITANG